MKSCKSVGCGHRTRYGVRGKGLENDRYSQGIWNKLYQVQQARYYRPRRAEEDVSDYVPGYRSWVVVMFVELRNNQSGYSHLEGENVSSRVEM